RLLGRAERSRCALKDRTGPGADDDVVAADSIDLGNGRHEIARVVRRIPSSYPGGYRVPERVHGLLAGAAGVFVRADPDEAAVIGRLYGAHLERHGLVTAAHDERRGQQAGAAQSQIPEEVTAGQ